MIKRYQFENGVVKNNPGGNWVRIQDHEKELKEAREYSEYLMDGSKLYRERIKELEDHISTLELAMLKVLQDKHHNVINAGPIG